MPRAKPEIHILRQGVDELIEGPEGVALVGIRFSDGDFSTEFWNHPGPKTVEEAYEWRDGEKGREPDDEGGVWSGRGAKNWASHSRYVSRFIGRPIRFVVAGDQQFDTDAALTAAFNGRNPIASHDGGD